MNVSSLGVVVVLLSPMQGIAADGALEVNQACVSTGCFTGDSPGFPVTISQPGNYNLTSNLTVSSSSQSGIVITVDNVSLDLRGFRVKGPTTCSGTPLTCTPASTGNGIDGIGTTRGSIIKNGVVSGFHWGVATDLGWRVSNMTSEHNDDLGFFIRKGTIVRDSAARSNGNVGFQVGELATLSYSVASNNRNFGVSTFDSDPGGGIGGATVEQNTIYANGTGIRDRGRSSITRNTIFSNQGVGYRSDNGGSLVTDNQIMNNSGLGISLLGGTVFSPTGLPILMRNNSLSNNNGAVAGAQIGGVGSYTETGPNLCGTDTVCP